MTPWGLATYVAAMSNSLTALDATFLELEQMDEGATMHIGGLMVFDPMPDGDAPTLDAVCENIASRLTLLPRYSQRLSSERTGGLTWPRWEDDPQFDLRNHVHRAALPAPGGDAELSEWAADYFSHRLDRTRPLWELVLVEGLAARIAGRSSPRPTTRSSTASARSTWCTSCSTPSRPRFPPPPSSGTPRAPGPDSLWQALLRPPDAVSDDRTDGHPRGRAPASTRRGTRARRCARARSVADLLVHDEIIARPARAINVADRSDPPLPRWCASRSPRCKAIRSELGGSVNDVLLAACTAGLRELLLSRGEEPPVRGLRAMVPMNVRESSERYALGNRVSSLFVELPVAERRPASRGCARSSSAPAS